LSKNSALVWSSLGGHDDWDGHTLRYCKQKSSFAQVLVQGL